MMAGERGGALSHRGDKRFDISSKSGADKQSRGSFFASPQSAASSHVSAGQGLGCPDTFAMTTKMVSTEGNKKDTSGKARAGGATERRGGSGADRRPSVRVTYLTR